MCVLCVKYTLVAKRMIRGIITVATIFILSSSLIIILIHFQIDCHWNFLKLFIQIPFIFIFAMDTLIYVNFKLLEVITMSVYELNFDILWYEFGMKFFCSHKCWSDDMFLIFIVFSGWSVKFWSENSIFATFSTQPTKIEWYKTQKVIYS